MEKIKQVFSPGSSKDDKILYASSDNQNETATLPADHAKQTDTIHTLPKAEKKDHTILGQIFNPGGDKYDETRFGTTASTQVDPNRLETDPEAKRHEHNIARQIFNPDGHKYDEQAFGTTAHTAGNPNTSSTTAHALDDKHGLQSTAPTTAGSAVTAGLAAPHSVPQDDASATSHARQTSSATAGYTSPSNTTATSHLDRDAALAGTGVAAGGLAGSQLHKQQDSVVDQPGHTSSSVPLVDRSRHTATGLSSDPLSSSTTTQGGAATGLDDRSSTGFVHGQAIHKPYEGYMHHTHGPHPTDAGNLLDPHVPGEYPSESHQAGWAAAIGSGNAGASSTSSGPVAGSAGLPSAARSDAERQRISQTLAMPDSSTSAGVVGGAAGVAAASGTHGTTSSHTATTQPAHQSAYDEAQARHSTTPSTNPSQTHSHHKHHDTHLDKGDKPQGFLQKILHPHGKSHDSDKHDHDHDTQHSSGTGVSSSTTGEVASSKHLGGTDASSTIPSQADMTPAQKDYAAKATHSAGTTDPAATGGQAGVAGPDWEAIKKANTPY